jgi:hypothetical protein
MHSHNRCVPEVEATRFSDYRHMGVMCQLHSTVTFTLRKVLLIFISVMGGPGSVVGIGTVYGLDGPGIESRLGRHFPHLSKGRNTACQKK